MVSPPPPVLPMITATSLGPSNEVNAKCHIAGLSGPGNECAHAVQVGLAVAAGQRHDGEAARWGHGYEGLRGMRMALHAVDVNGH